MEEEYAEMFGESPYDQSTIDYMEMVSQLQECEHTSTIVDGNKKICNACGCEVDVIDHEAEWKYHGSNAKSARCTRFREPDKGSNIRKIFEDNRISEDLVNEQCFKRCESKYREVVESQNVHGVKRKAIVAACLFHVFREDGIIRQIKELKTYFKLTNKQMLDGMTAYRVRFPESRTINITTSSIVKRNIEILKIDKVHEAPLLDIVAKIEAANAEITRSSPTSIAPAIIYVYLSCITPQYKASLGITKQSFAGLMGLSEITIGKLSKTIAGILDLKLVD
jgi:transcription initiation factor TFIIIB Brf1 subunit/transcription initiation factor TFIIB